jgi:hypothetical protein
MLRVALGLEGVHEVGFNNRGPQVEEIQRADDLPGGGYAWCVSFKQFCADLLDFTLPSQTASVGFLERGYRRKGWMVDAPVRGADGMWCLDEGTWPDHWITVEKVLSTSGSTWKVQTIEGNTSKGFGSVQDGGGAYRRTRIISKGQVRWGLAKGVIADARVGATIQLIEKARKEKKIVRLTVAKKAKLLAEDRGPPEEALYWLWLRWKLGEGEFKKSGPSKPARRPKVLPDRVPKAWHKRALKFVIERKKG